MEEFNFFFMLKLSQLIFQLVTPTLTAIQAKYLPVGAVLGKIRLVREATLSQRTESAFNSFWAECKDQAEARDINPPRLRRLVRLPRRLGGGNDHQPATPEDLYRQKYFEALDNLASSLQSRFSSGDDVVLQGVEAALAGDQASVWIDFFIFTFR